MCRRWQTRVGTSGIHLRFVQASVRPALDELSVAGTSDLKATYYDYGVAVYCSLVDARVAAGFERERQRIIARDGLDEAEIRVARMHGWTEVELEWDNRGLGGFRGWCKTEGKAAVERFLAVPE